MTAKGSIEDSWRFCNGLMMKSLVQLFSLIVVSFSFFQCADRKLDANETHLELKIAEAYIQEQVPGQEDQSSKWIFTIQPEESVVLEALVLGDQTYKLSQSGETWQAELNSKYSSESDIPSIRFLTLVADGKIAKVPIPKIVLKEALYMP
jgi:hypothetical protein